VVCLLKALVGDGQVRLGDGRRLLSSKVLQREFSSLPSNAVSSDLDVFCKERNIVPIHNDFRLFVLANRPGFPFLGNNFFRECGDLFTTIVRFQRAF
jgi:hypothetical protein